MATLPIEEAKVKIELLTAEDFLLFGDVIEANEAAEHFTINCGYTERYHNLANVEVTHTKGKAGISIFASQPLPIPLQLKLLERHPLSSQAFIPLDQEPYLVVVAPPGEFNSEAIRFFIARPDQGVNYHAGTWHHFCLALNQKSRFLVVDRIGTDPETPVKNCDEFFLKEPIVLSRENLNKALEQLSHSNE